MNYNAKNYRIRRASLQSFTGTGYEHTYGYQDESHNPARLRTRVKKRYTKKGGLKCHTITSFDLPKGCGFTEKEGWDVHNMLAYSRHDRD